MIIEFVEKETGGAQVLLSADVFSIVIIF